MWDDLRGYLSFLERQTDLITVARPVKTRFEVAAYARRTSDLEGPAFLFEEIENYPGWRVAAGLFSARRRVAAILDGPTSGCWRGLHEAINHPVQPKRVSDGPCKEIIWKQDDIDLTRLPIPWHSEKDAAPYITAAVDFIRDPDDRTSLAGIHRMQLKGKDRLGFWAGGTRSASRALAKQEKNGKGLEIAVAVGVEPRIVMASQAKVPYGTDKIAIAGGLKKRPVDMARCETIDVEVPASSEIVIEGELIPHHREDEGPFREFPGCYGHRTASPILQVKAITMRRNPIYLTALAGVPDTENNLIAWPSICELIYRRATLVTPEIREVNTTGNRYYTALVSVRKRVEGEPPTILSTILGSIPQVKFCIVVDDDANVHDPRKVEWAIQTRVQPHEDVYIYPVMAGVALDPSAPMPGHSSKMGFDATVPAGAPRERYEKAYVPGVEAVSW